MGYVRYIDKTRAYYAEAGYDKPYQWANFDEVPFTPLKKPLAESTVTLISTSEIGIKEDPDLSKRRSELDNAGNVYSLPADTPPAQLYSRTHSFDSHETHMEDVNSYFPVTRLQEAVASGRIGSLTPRLHGLYNSYSKRKTLGTDAPEVLRRCREDGVDVAVLVPV